MQLCVLAYQTIHKFKNKQKVYFILVIFMDFCNVIPYIYKFLLIFDVFLLLHNVSAEWVSTVRSDANCTEVTRVTHYLSGFSIRSQIKEE